MKRSKVELTEAAVRKAIEEKKPKSMTQLAHILGYKGSVSSTLTKRFRALVPDIQVLLQGATPAAAGDKGKAEAAAPKSGEAPKGKPASGKAKAKPAAKAAAQGRWKRDPRNPFRQGSSYALCFDILAAHKDGLPREKLIELLAAAAHKDVKHAGYDAQVLLSARANESGLNPNEGPRHPSCRPGFWVELKNSHVKLMVD